MASLTRIKLDSMVCQDPGCEHKDHSQGLIFSGKCHKGAPTVAKYLDGVLHLRCAVCKAPVAQFLIADGIFN
jgi:hypothetical protein